MKLSIIRQDKSVTINNKTHKVEEVFLLSEDIHAIQWNNTYGWIEYISDEETQIKPANQNINSIEEYSFIIEKWNNINDQPVIFNDPRSPEHINIVRAKRLLKLTDWVELESVNDISVNPRLMNKSEFDDYRLNIRKILLSKPTVLYEFDSIPKSLWSEF